MAERFVAMRAFIRLTFDQQRAQGRIGLQDVAFEGQQRHADGGVREGAVEAPLAGLQSFKSLG